MVARGDMGVELPPEQVPIWQKRIIAAANAALVPVITATQMLESMVHEPRPTRAEVTDVATAIWDGTDAVMLSAETSIGAYPVESVTMMDRICRATEGDGASQRPTMDARRASTYADAISLAAYHIAGASPAVTAIAAFTRDGATARLISKQRPAAPILGLCAGDRVARRLALYHGVVPIPVELVDEVEGLVRVAETEGARAGVLATGDTVLITGHLPLEAPGSTNFLLLHRAGDAVTSPESRVQSPESGV
jgi:pyruvate kinase